MAETKAQKEAEDTAAFFGNKTKGQERAETLDKLKFDPAAGGGADLAAAARKRAAEKKAKEEAEAAAAKKPSPNAQAAQKAVNKTSRKK